MITVCVVGKFYSAPKGLLIIIMQSSSFFGMDFFYLCSNSLFAHMNRIVDQPIAFLQPDHCLRMIYLSDCFRKLKPDFFIWNMHGFLFRIICQITEMNQQCQYIILTLKGYEIICKPGGIHSDLYATDQLSNCFGKSLIIFADVFHQSRSSRCLCPVRIEIIIVQCFHHRIWIIHRSDSSESIAVIPLLHRFKAYTMFAAKNLYFLLCEAHILPIQPGLDDRKFFKIRYCRLCSIFLYRQNSCHVGCGEDPVRQTGVFKQSPQEFQVLFLHSGSVLRFPDGGIPLIDNHDELIACYSNCVEKRCRKIFSHLHVRISRFYFFR